MLNKESFFTKTWVVFLLAFLSCALWGSAFPCVKIGYRLFGIGGAWNDSLLYAGVRFLLAGVMIIVFCSCKQKRFVLPGRTNWKYVLVLSLFQTIGQYIFYYIGLYRTAGIKASVINSTGVFLSILTACFLFKLERFTLFKFIGCILGVFGVILVNLGGEFTFSFSFTGEGFLILSCVLSALAGNFSKLFSRYEDPVTLSGWQFLVGGIILIAVGLAGGGSLHPASPLAFVMLTYLALISAVAFSLMGIFLKYNPVSRVSSYKTLTPVLGFVFSAIFLSEGSLLRVETFVALIVTSLGIFLINRYGDQQIKINKK